MNRLRIHELIPFRQLLQLLIGFSVVFQALLISFNHFSGYYTVTGIQDFVDRLLYSSFLSLIAALFLAYPDLYIINGLNRKLSWNKKALNRLFTQLLLAVLVGLSVAVGITLLAHGINAYQQTLSSVLLRNSMIVVVINTFLMAILEGWIFFSENEAVKKRTAELERELTGIRFEVLKQQINPHFMFNSLNVLSGLIDQDVEKAQQFIDEFSRIFRYVLETIEKSVVTLSDELDFVRSYIFLQEIRYGANLHLTVDIPAQVLNLYLPPLSLQTVLENAIKHNIISTSQPLDIRIYEEDRSVVVSNTIQHKKNGMQSTGLGLQNLSKRYELVSWKQPSFIEKKSTYVAKLPLINPDEDERRNY